ncbi:MAG TPA: peptidase [Oceanospirillales bacterium]|nr:peptidase [Oceanospirillaceae bacterium]HBS42890.1 peptidase [Oceanospirillales bacterium]|tara:strand:- start:5178 stop:7688 length:2511 start_codon:yes stop_codon:yes gene_type:complete
MTRPKALYLAIFWLLMAVSSATLMGVSAIYLYLEPGLPDAEALKEVELQTPLRVYTADGLLISEFGEKRRTPIAYDDIPQQFIDALLASEDEGFFEHSGIAVKGLARAVFELVTTGRKQSGGSTITMQVAKNYYLSSEKTFTRKFTEILLALKIEEALSKEEILELYVNKVYFGKRAYGIEAASQVYYGKPIRELNLAQLAMIAGLPQAPSAANPVNNPQRAIARRNYVLGRMLQLGKITEEDYRSAADAPIVAGQYGADSEVDAAYVAEMARQEMLRRFGGNAYTDGYKVYTTVIGRNQTAANDAIQRGLLAFDRTQGYRGVSASLPVVTLMVEDNPVLQEWFEQTQPGHDINWPETLQQWHSRLLSMIDQSVVRAGIIAGNNNGSYLVYTKSGFVRLNRTGTAWAFPERQPDLKTGDVILVENTPAGARLAQIPEIEGALVSLDPRNGSIKALVGGFSYSENQFNRVIQSERQPGSSFKPFIYSAALANGFTTASIVNDAPVIFQDEHLESAWRPENYSGRFYGPTRLRQALYRSQNLVSIRILKQIGLSAALNHLENFGFHDLNRDLSLALGSSVVTPLGLAEGYSIFANGGYKIRAHIIERIENDEGEVLYQADPVVAPECEYCAPIAAGTPDDTEDFDPDDMLLGSSATDTAETEEKQRIALRVLDSRNRFLTVNMMQDVIRRGTGRKALALGRSDLAGKTGTTNDQKDTWFSGFNPELVSTVWVGYDQPRTLGRSASGGSTALPIWIDYMKVALAGMPEGHYEQPAGIVSARIDPDTGLLARPDQSDAIFEYFREENLPTEYANPHVGSPYGTTATDEDFNSELTPEQLF